MDTRIAAIFLLVAPPCLAAKLSATAAVEFDRYIATLEARIRAQRETPETEFATLNIVGGKRADLERSLFAGNETIEPVNGGSREMDGALLHHWRAACFLPHATPVSMLALLRDYSHIPLNYAPQIVSSRLIKENGDAARIAVRLKEQKVITVTIDAEYEVESGLLGGGRGYGYSRGLHFFEVDSPGTSRERRRKEGDDDGFLWRLNSYWTFGRVGDGLMIECEAVSLTRDVPFGLDWLITPIIRDLPREALQFTLDSTKKALTKEIR